MRWGFCGGGAGLVPQLAVAGFVHGAGGEGSRWRGREPVDGLLERIGGTLVDGGAVVAGLVDEGSGGHPVGMPAFARGRAKKHAGAREVPSVIPISPRPLVFSRRLLRRNSNVGEDDVWASAMKHAFPGWKECSLVRASEEGGDIRSGGDGGCRPREARRPRWWRVPGCMSSSSYHRWSG